MNPNRVLQTMVLAPANPDAQNFPKGQVQFTATGTFSKTPSPDMVTFEGPHSGGWTLMGAGAASIATIRQAGLAQCIAGGGRHRNGAGVGLGQRSDGTGATSVVVSGTTTMSCP
jgi:hypothetical protein